MNGFWGGPCERCLSYLPGSFRWREAGAGLGFLRLRGVSVGPRFECVSTFGSWKAQSASREPQAGSQTPTSLLGGTYSRTHTLMFHTCSVPCSDDRGLSPARGRAQAPEEACVQKTQSGDLCIGRAMPQDFPLKLSVLWLGPANNFTATECVLSLPFLPSVLRFSRSFLNGS